MQMGSHFALMALGGAATGLVFRRDWSDHLAAWIFVQPALWPLLHAAAMYPVLEMDGIPGPTFFVSWRELAPFAHSLEAAACVLVSLLVLIAQRWATMTAGER